MGVELRPESDTDPMGRQGRVYSSYTVDMQGGWGRGRLKRDRRCDSHAQPRRWHPRGRGRCHGWRLRLRVTEVATPPNGPHGQGAGPHGDPEGGGAQSLRRPRPVEGCDGAGISFGLRGWDAREVGFGEAAGSMPRSTDADSGTSPKSKRFGPGLPMCRSQTSPALWFQVPSPGSGSNTAGTPSVSASHSLAYSANSALALG